MTLSKTLMLSIFLVISLVVSVSAKEIKKDSLPCTLCTTLVEDLESWITSDTTEQQITDWIATACEAITQINDQFADYVNMCKLVLHAEITEILEGLIAGYSPEKVCTDIHICT
eukprot:TRINITY_DN28794_c0_g1_i1.p1 TRINITY_DN28794_c0_g1~~TRINITY_DN28794_c0_g1_i1.p1  ORF type:complete len:114 (-),score=7.91 TRINITY_DN28794_c0_g1_i1:232-573(-)